MPPKRPTPETDHTSVSFSRESLKDAVRGGTRAMAAAQIVYQVFGLAILAFLYRLLGPSPYGLIGMVIPFLLFLQMLTKMGLDVVTMQRRELSTAQISTLFWLTMALGVAMAVVAAAIAPALAWFYEEPELVTLTVALAGTCVGVALCTQHHALLQRKLKMTQLAVSRLAAQALAGVAAVVAAFAGWGVWALVVQQYVDYLLLGALLWTFEPWRPGPPQRNVQLRELVRFGGFFTTSNVLYFLTTSVDKVLVGYAFGREALGLYSQAFALMMKPVDFLIRPITDVMLPGLSRAAHDPEAYRQMVYAFYRLVGVVSLPCGVGLAIVAPEAMLLLGGEAWSAAGSLLRVLGLVICLQGFVNIAGSVFTSAGKTRLLFVAASVMAVVFLTAYLIAIGFGQRLQQPEMAVAASYTLTLVVVVAPYLLVCMRFVDVPAVQLFSQLRPALWAAGGMGVAVILVRWGLLNWLDPSPIVLLALEIPIGVAVYTALAWGELRWFLHQLRRASGGGEVAP